jgi:uncharacterized protein YkwD
VRRSRSYLPLSILAAVALLASMPSSALARPNRHHGHGRHGHATIACVHHRHQSPHHRRTRVCAASRSSAPHLRLRRVHSGPVHHAQAPSGQDAQARSAAIARALAAPCENTQVTPQPGNLDAARAAVLCLVNHRRAESNETPLAANARLQAAAEAHVSDMISADYFQHVSPTGITPVDRVRESGYIPGPEVGYLVGENLAWGTLSLSTPEAIVHAWFNSPEHLANILEGGYADTGIALTPAVPASLGDGSAGATYAQEFGTIVR